MMMINNKRVKDLHLENQLHDSNRPGLWLPFVLQGVKGGLGRGVGGFINMGFWIQGVLASLCELVRLIINPTKFNMFHYQFSVWSNG